MQGMTTVYGNTIPDNVYSLAPAGEGGVWIGTHTGGAYHWDKEKLSRLHGSHFSSWTIVEDRQGVVWSGAYDRGLFCHRDNGLTGILPTVSKYPFAFMEDRRGRMWVGGDFGLACYDQGTVTGFAPPFFEKTKFEWVISLKEDADGAIWVGTKLGFLYRFVDGKFETHWTSKTGQEYPVCSLHIDREGALWMARFGKGLTRLKNGVFTHYGASEGLPVSTINGILDDGENSLWMSSKHGVYHISYDAFEAFAEGEPSISSWRHFTVNDGLPSNVCQGEQNQPSLCQTADGCIWIPTIGGVGYIDPDLVREQMAPPPVVIQHVTLYGDDNRESTLLADGDFSWRSEDNPVSLTIPPGRNNLMIRYTAIDFVEPKRVHFSYRIVGLDNNWVDAKNERTALITNLEAGSYRFELRASNHRGQLGETKALAFVVLPFWWETTIFRGLLSLGGVLSGVLWFYSRVEKLKKKNREQADFSRQLIDREESERKRISQALHDSLGHELLLVRNRALDGVNRADTAQDQQRFESISDLAGQALENARGMAYNLRPFELDRIGFHKAVETMIEKISESSQTRYFKEIDEVVELLSDADLVHLYRLIQEGLNNILKHAEASVVMLEIKREDTQVRVRLDDNGVGFDAGNPSSGLGVNGMMERTSLIGGTFHLSTSPGEGTRILIQIPLRPQDIVGGGKKRAKGDQ